MKTSPVDKSKLIGSRIKALREAANISQLQLAEAVGFESNTAISLIESGERNVSVDVLEKIAEVLHIDIKHLLGHDEIKLNLTYALRADNDLSLDEKKRVIEFIDFIKSKKHGKSGK